MRNQVWTISTLVRYLKSSLDNDMNIQSVLVKGEISNFTNHRSGHLYFSLKDSGGKLSCVMFSSHASRLKITPKEGMQVIVQAKVSMYEAQGNLQLYVTAMQSDGIGDLYLQLEALKEKLAKEGLFASEFKKQLPAYPTDIAVVSAKTGAAIQDVLSIIARRWPLANVSVYPTLVQGDKASENMITTLLEADTKNHDVVLLVRGGGSLEDLWCFNNEALARVIYNMKTCIVSGVGHETDTTLVDYVSDHRAPTPSAAAELVTPDYKEIKQQVEAMSIRMKQRMQFTLNNESLRLDHIKSKAMFTNAQYFIQNEKMRFEMLIKSLFQTEKNVQKQRHQLQNQQELLFVYMQRYVNDEKTKLKRNIALLDAFSPLKILKRGYSIAFIDKKAVRSIDDLKEHDQFQLLVNDGTIHAKVEKREHNGRK